MRTASKKNRSSAGGFTLLELLLASAIMSIGILGMVASFRYFNVGIQSAKGRSLANNLAQERVEYLKNKSYYRVLVTTATASDGNFSPALVYDLAPNGDEELTVGGISFRRRVYIRKVSENPSTGQLEYKSWNDPDTGLKEIAVFVSWFEGGNWKKAELRNLLENPNRMNLSASFAGNVKDLVSTVNLSSVVVRAQENPSRYDYTDGSGNYYFDIEPGTYTLMASVEGYFLKTRPTEVIDEGEALSSRDFQLTQMSSGTITGNVYMRDHLVISQVVGSSVNVYGQEQEWVEVYNPTTWTWTMATGLGIGSNELVHIAYEESAEDEIIPDIDYRTLSLVPGAYYLFANTGTVTAAGVTKTADAVYDADGNWGTGPDDLIKTGNPSPAGHVILGSDLYSRTDDLLGWNATGNGVAAKKTAEKYEGSAIIQSVGFQVGESYTRKTGASGVTAGLGRCHDYNYNDTDFVDHVPLIYAPRNSSDSEVCQSGTPAAGAAVFAEDGLSSTVIADASGYFNLMGVATGYWTVYASSGSYLGSSSPVGGLAHGFVYDAEALWMSTFSSYGYVSGLVTDVDGSPMWGVKVYAGGAPGFTRSDGRYTVLAPAGENSVAANYQTHDPSYIEYSSMGVVVTAGLMTYPPVNFTLTQGGRLSGWVTTNGVDPLPNIPVTALKGGIEQGNTVSGSDGKFLVWGAGISTGTYDVVPQLDAGEASSPSTYTVTLAAGETLFVGTFTITGSMGYISGSVKVAAAPITTGVLIYATSGTIAGVPPTLDSSLRGGAIAYYAVSSDAAGHYELAVRGGYDYNLYAWYTTWSGQTPATTVKSHSAVTVDPGGSVEKDFVW
ncbi:MAG: prepilin-type N-terminal cleavage/methylation domain-containing protein [Elusimicrobiales bacterium]|nr:prepilin-type N-terminal cleavage/methylation domain-containing protein [Elusimicrobiales bacterium]